MADVRMRHPQGGRLTAAAEMVSMYESQGWLVVQEKKIPARTGKPTRTAATAASTEKEKP